MRRAENIAELVWDGHSCPSNAGSGRHPGKSRTLAIVVPILLTMLAPLASGQRAASFHASHASQGRTLQHTTPRNGSYARGTRFSSYRRQSLYNSLPFPFFTGAFDPADIYSTGYPVASEPPPYVLQAAAAMAASGANPLGRYLTSYDRAPSSQPLMIELQNGRYVRVKAAMNEDSKDGESQELTPEKFQHGSLPLAPQPASQVPTLPPAVLIFRDGHSEEVRDYTIADGILYARGDYYIDGYWNKKIALSTLNVAQTLQANSARNINFVLPSSPNEVITRP